ncbi:hypothetical protein BGZ96_004728 [Linnemannia gamsii]|uniref:Uncharacterized protein n=1 Tax=Linnemannia gamsii TaxID=64522 RepID=A0ABQ7KGS6_9FUNG|nr:hypothetical protein BGZ96_004728 [Linnemannia gamsii]
MYVSGAITYLLLPGKLYEFENGPTAGLKGLSPVAFYELTRYDFEKFIPNDKYNRTIILTTAATTPTEEIAKVNDHSPKVKDEETDCKCKEPRHAADSPAGSNKENEALD